jgi:hypothetical protein
MGRFQTTDEFREARVGSGRHGVLLLMPEGEVSLSSAARGFRPQSGHEFPDRFLALCTDESKLADWRR